MKRFTLILLFVPFTAFAQLGGNHIVKNCYHDTVHTRVGTVWTATTINSPNIGGQYVVQVNNDTTTGGPDLYIAMGAADTLTTSTQIIVKAGENWPIGFYGNAKIYTRASSATIPRRVQWW